MTWLSTGRATPLDRRSTQPAARRAVRKHTIEGSAVDVRKPAGRHGQSRRAASRSAYRRSTRSRCVWKKALKRRLTMVRSRAQRRRASGSTSSAPAEPATVAPGPSFQKSGARVYSTSMPASTHTRAAVHCIVTDQQRAGRALLRMHSVCKPRCARRSPAQRAQRHRATNFKTGMRTHHTRWREDATVRIRFRARATCAVCAGREPAFSGHAAPPVASSPIPRVSWHGRRPFPCALLIPLPHALQTVAPLKSRDRFARTAHQTRRARARPR